MTEGWATFLSYRSRSHGLLHTIELRPAVADILQVFMERGRLIVHAERRIRRALPELHLHILADLLLRRGIRCVEPGGPQLFHHRIGRPAEPAAVGAAAADR